ncbi:MAG: pseudaminic acid cytidylyltransferase [Granulosicoccus sp.]|jgi:N-acylneuraminate cytidylyltransferase
MQKIAIIPARGGSKRIPGKNVKPFHGRPIISYAITAAVQSKLFDRIIVSTDCEKIAEVATEYGAEVPFLRSHETANDTASMAQAIIETLTKLAGENQCYEQVCCLFATAPFVDAQLILKAQSQLSERDSDSVIVVQQNSNPIMRSLQVDETGHLGMVWKNHLRTRSQDLAHTYHDAAQMYWAKTSALIEQGTFYTNKASALCIGELEAHDIDTPEDWTIAERLWAFNQRTDTAA